MARYTGPRVRILRKLAADLPGLTRKQAGLRKNKPGQHGDASRKPASEYGKRLLEKQKLIFNYGISEKQLKNYFLKAHHSKQQTGRQLLRYLESRLDNVVFRSGFAPTIPAAKQLVGHGHILVNNKKVDKPSVMVKPGDTLTLHQRSKNNLLILDSFQNPSLAIPAYLKIDANALAATMIALPEREDASVLVNDNHIVEFYARLT